MYQDKIDLMGYTVTEPSVAFTNFILMGFCLYWAAKLKSLATQNEGVRYWRWFFFAMAAAAFIGAFDHSTRFYPHIYGTIFPKMAWISSALGVYFVEMSAIVLLTSDKWKKIFSYLVILQFSLFIIALFSQHHFMWVNINSAIGTLGVLGGIHAHFYLKEKRPSSRLVWIAIFILPSIFIVKGIKLHFLIFNHHDLAHFILVGSLYFFFLAAKEIMLTSNN